MLRSGGVVIISVPDMEGTLDWLEKDETRDFAIRHITGSKRDGYAHHRTWFRNDDLKWLLGFYGFKDIQQLPNFHLYPALVMRARKQ